MDAFKSKPINERINRIDFFPNRIKQHAFATGKDVKRNARETSACAHIQETLGLKGKIASKGERIDNMKNKSLVHILDAGEVHILIHLLDIQEMFNAQSSFAKLDIDIHQITQGANFLRKRINLRRRCIEVVKRNNARIGINRHSDIAPF